MAAKKCETCKVVTNNPCRTSSEIRGCYKDCIVCGHAICSSHGGCEIPQGTEAEPAEKDAISPEHYSRFEIEPIEFIVKNKLDYPTGNVIKYVCRHDHKNGLEDLLKAKRYIDIMIEEHYGSE